MSGANSSANGGNGGTGGAGGNGGNGGGGNNGGGDLTPENVNTYITNQAGGDPKRAVELLLRQGKRYRRRLSGDRTQQIDGLAEDLREDLNDANETIRRLSQNQIPAGHVTVPVADRDALAAYRAINADPAALKTIVDDVPKLKGNLAKIEKGKTSASAAKIMKWNANALTRVAEKENFEIEIRDVDVEVDGKTEKRQRPFARVAGDDKAAWVELDKFMDAGDMKLYLPSLRESESDDDSDSHSTTNSQSNASSTESVTIPRQRTSTGSAPKQDAASGYANRTFVPPSKRNATADKK
jgi:hypothetical protein